MGKGEIAHYEQYLLFPQCFQKACFPGGSKGVIVWEWVKSCGLKTLENEGKVEITSKQHFLLFPSFLQLRKHFNLFTEIMADLLSAKCF